MAKIKVIHDTIGETLTIYFHEPSENHICEELGNGSLLIKDENTGETVGFEQLNYKPKEPHRLIIESESFTERTN